MNIDPTHLLSFGGDSEDDSSDDDMDNGELERFSLVLRAMHTETLGPADRMNPVPGFKRRWKKEAARIRNSKESLDLPKGPREVNWNSLPDEVLSLIFSNLHPVEWATCALVCSRWHRVIHENDVLWRDKLRTVLKQDPNYLGFFDQRLQLHATMNCHLHTTEECIDAKSCRCRSQNCKQKGPYMGVKYNGRKKPLIQKDGGMTYRESFQKRWNAAAGCIDAGSGYLRCAWSHGQPGIARFCATQSTIIGTASMESTEAVLDAAHHLLTGDDDDVLRHAVVSIPSPQQSYDRTNARQHIEHVLTVMLERHALESVTLVPQPHAVLLQEACDTGMVVNIGFQRTTVDFVYKFASVPVELDMKLEVGAMQVTLRLAQLLERRGIPYSNMFVVRNVKDKHCYVTEPFPQNGGQHIGEKGACTWRVNGSRYTLDQERWMAPEVLFHPAQFDDSRHFYGTEGPGLSHFLLSRICESWESHRQGYEHVSGLISDCLSNVIISGGGAVIPGISERILSDFRTAKEQKGKLPVWDASGSRYTPFQIPNWNPEALDNVRISTAIGRRPDSGPGNTCLEGLQEVGKAAELPFRWTVTKKEWDEGFCDRIGNYWEMWY
eukprot:Clim_evm48s210 gene=Clim_evmTU48s210